MTRRAARCGASVNQVAGEYARILELRFGDDLTVPEIAKISAALGERRRVAIVAGTAGVPRKLGRGDVAGNASAAQDFREMS